MELALEVSFDYGEGVDPFYLVESLEERGLFPFRVDASYIGVEHLNAVSLQLCFGDLRYGLFAESPEGQLFSFVSDQLPALRLAQVESNLFTP